jgi:hypothetical protein
LGDQAKTLINRSIAKLLYVLQKEFLIGMIAKKIILKNLTDMTDAATNGGLLQQILFILSYLSLADNQPYINEGISSSPV